MPPRCIYIVRNVCRPVLVITYSLCFTSQGARRDEARGWYAACYVLFKSIEHAHALSRDGPANVALRGERTLICIAVFRPNVAVDGDFGVPIVLRDVSPGGVRCRLHPTSTAFTFIMK